MTTGGDPLDSYKYSPGPIPEVVPHIAQNKHAHDCLQVGVMYVDQKHSYIVS